MPEEKLRADYAAIDRDYNREVRAVAVRPKIMQVALFVWAMIDVALIIFFVVNVILYVVSGSFAELRTISTVAANTGVAHTVAVSRAAKPMLVNDTKVLTRDVGSYDMYAVVENPNDEWYATFDYSFTAGDLTTAALPGSLMPLESRYVLGLGVKTDSRPTSADLVIANVVWHRVDAHVIPNTAEFLTNHSNFTVDTSAYSADIVLAEETIGSSSVTLTNGTAYSYFAPTYAVLVKRSGTIVAINQVTVSEFLTGETRDVVVHWFGSVPTNGTVEVVPMINYFSDTTYMAPPGELGADRRDNVKQR